MNILIRIENREDIARIEETLTSLPLDLYFVRDDSHMLSILEQSAFDAVLVGFSTDQNIVIHSIRNLKEHDIGSAIPVILCCEIEENFESDSIHDMSSDFDRFVSTIERCYKVEVLWQTQLRSRSSFSKLAVR